MRKELPGRIALRYVAASHQGPSAARNAGVKRATAPIILFMDDDCEAHQGLVATHVSETSGCGTVTIGRVIWHPHLTVTPFMDLVTHGAQFNYGAISDPEDVPFSCFYTSNVSVSREDLVAVGGFDEGLPLYGEDTELGYRLHQSGAQLRYRPRAIVFHDQPLELRAFLHRQRRAGRAAVQILERHPELRSALGVDAVADVRLREQFYSVLLRFAFVLGVEDELIGKPDGLCEDLSITGSDLRSQFEAWVSESAASIATEVRAVEERVRQLEAQIDDRDVRFADTVKDKDRRLADLEAELRRYQRFWPLRLLHFLRNQFQA